MKSMPELETIKEQDKFSELQETLVDVWTIARYGCKIDGKELKGYNAAIKYFNKCTKK